MVVDNHFACIGGLDLCFGRWDTHTHPLADVHPTEFSLTLFPGQDYNNARVMDFREVYNYASNTLSTLDTARMPWHDVRSLLVLSLPLILQFSTGLRELTSEFTGPHDPVWPRRVRYCPALCRTME